MIRVGTAGWSYPDWDGVVWPRARAGFHPLARLAETFDCVEVNSTFYGYPSPRNAERWLQVVHERRDFRFLVKLHRDFTHGPWDPDAPSRELEDRARAFRAGVEPLARARRLSALLVQFPVSFLHGKREVRRLGWLHGLFGELPLALELRHDSWFEPPALAMLRGLGYSLVHVDLPRAWNHPPADHAPTGPIGYLRLHGRNADAWFRAGVGRDAKYDWLYSGEELDAVTERIRRIAARHADVFVVTNNHFAGKAVANGVEILFRLRGEPVPVSAELVAAFPHLAPMTKVEGQQGLFG